jgi:hypothetical protein
MKNNFYFLLALFLCCLFQQAFSQKAQIYKLEKLYKPQLDKGDYSVWKGEKILIPVRFDSKDLTEVEVSFKGPEGSLQLFQLHQILADLSAGNCGTTKTQGTFEQVSIPDRAELMPARKFKPTSENQWLILQLSISKDISPGTHPYSFTFTQKGKKSEVKGFLEVKDRYLDGFSELSFYTDFWQFPVSVADYYKIKPWSEPHWKEVETMFDQLNAINQHSITTQVFWDLYNTKIRPLDEMMIQVRKSSSGTYSYDYSIFDRFVLSAMDRGISGQIALHNLFPWNGFIFYFDEAKDQVISIRTQPGTVEYNEFWKPFLLDFEKHLHSKNWLQKTVLFVDERDPNQTLELAKWVKELAPGLSMGFSGDFYPFLSPWIKDYSTPMNVVIDPSELSKRVLYSQNTSIYTSCFEQANQPNFLLTSDFRDIYFLTQLAKARGYNGYLRWAFNLWSSEIEESAIYSDLPSGDAHMIYPNGQVSTRYLVLEDALEEIRKLEIFSKISNTSEMMSATNRYFLINIEADRFQMVQAMKNYLND